MEYYAETLDQPAALYRLPLGPLYTAPPRPAAYEGTLRGCIEIYTGMGVERPHYYVELADGEELDAGQLDRLIQFLQD